MLSALNCAAYSAKFMEITLPESLSAFLAWLPTMGAFMLVMTLGLERVPNWENWNSDLKSLIAAIVAVALGFLGKALTTWIPAGIVPSAAEVYTVLFNAMVIFAGSTYAHFKIHVENKAASNAEG